LNITVNVTDVDLDSILEPGIESDGETHGHMEPVTLREAVIQRVAGDVLTRMAHEDRAAILRRISEIRAEVIRELVTPILEEAVASGVQRTNTFGEPTGPVKPLRDIVLEEARAALTKREYHDRPTFVEKVVREEVQRTIREELQAEIKAEAEKAKAAIRAKAAELIAEEAAKR
jgi:hypothetical protein